MINGPYIVTSPVAPVGTSLPAASRILSSSVGTGCPTEVGFSTASRPEIAVATDDDSVKPYAFVVVPTFGNVSWTLRCSSSAEGEPPNATLTISYQGAQEAVNSTQQNPILDPTTIKTMATGGGLITAANIDELDGYAFIWFVVDVAFPAPPVTPTTAVLPSVDTITINYLGTCP